MTPTDAEDALDDLRNYADGESVPADEARAVVAAELERLRGIEQRAQAVLHGPLVGAPQVRSAVTAARYILGEG